MATMTEPQRDLPIAGEYDVVVCGGGTAGVPAAIAAARQGAKVALIERYGFVGGVPAYSIMPCWHGLRGNHSGILTEFVNRVVEFGQGPNPLTEHDHMEPETVKIIGLKMLLEAGVEIHLHNWLAGVIKEGDRIVAAVTESKSGRRAFKAKTFVDATGDGDLSAYAGAGFTKGVDGKMQGVTLRFRIGHVDFDRYFDWVGENMEYYKTISTAEDVARLRQHSKDGTAFYLGADLTPLYNEHPERDLPAHTYFNCSSIRPGELSVNSTRIYGIDGTIEEDLTKAEITCRPQAYAIWQFLRDFIPGFEKSMMVDVPAQVGVRETRSIIGEYILSEAECRANQEFEDSIMTAQIMFDAHDIDRYLLEVLKGAVDIPIGCFLPKGTEGLVVVGRCISSDHIANSGIRKMESVFQTGQAGGTIAAMAALKQQPLRDLDVTEVRDVLKKGEFRVSQENRYLHQDDVIGLKRETWLANRKPKKWANEMFKAE
ncbi:FAD-dependent oxidoreductase [Oceaniglobus trochenteri]|uniref:FAD-dependent oxidoreductase n=1 Tax=Oceaniglobus trochenteri TaxID=2763260 RepID=UPI00247B26D9|nr:FAD-dependent oxidoreductase [Oceaniglobus trochenteri]